ncbi:hypothetical protein [Ancylobacter terrae]
MWDQVLPVLSAILLAHGWITVLMIGTLSEMDDAIVLPPEALVI